MMAAVCRQCGKEITGDGISFCPYCGSRLEAIPEKAVSKEAEEWIRKSLSVTSLPERKKILEQAKKACPEDPEIDWELLFIGTPDPKPPRGKVDFSIIKSWLLQIYRKPDDFSAEKRDAMRHELFHGAQLQSVLASCENQEQKMREYLERLCREYVDIFLKEDNQLMGNIFGLRIGRNRTKILENAAAEMIRRAEGDELLSDEEKQMLRESMIRALQR